jgi:UDP-N-acetylmuramate dehydrogenase
MMAVADSLRLRGELRHAEPMARHTSWRAGGAAARFYRPADLADLAEFLRGLPAEEPLLWCGLGSNLLVRDGGWPGTVIYLQGCLNGLQHCAELEVRAEAGVPCAKVARYCARLGLAGAEFLAGIPGTMGGALAMNAGAFGGETWERVARVETVDRSGTLHRRQPDEYAVGYRQVRGPQEEGFVAVTLALQPDAPDAIQARIRALLARRGATQPTNQPSCGSVFRNPPGDHAARLTDEAGLKGYRIGGAQVSEKHANFIVNTGNATAGDIEALIEHVRAMVAKRFGVRLETEVRIVGEAAK